MKNKIALFFLLFMAGVIFICYDSIADAPASMTVSTNSVMILPPRPINNAADWVSNSTNAQGSIVKNGFNYYWASVGGVSTTTGPTHAYGDAVCHTTTWRKLEKGDRATWVVTVNATNNIFVSVGSSAVVDKGIRLNANGGSISMSNAEANDPVFAIAGSTNNVICVQEFTEK